MYTYTIVQEDEFSRSVVVIYSRGDEKNIIRKVAVSDWNRETIKKEILLTAQQAFRIWEVDDTFERTGVDMSQDLEVPITFFSEAIPLVSELDEDLVQTFTTNPDGSESLTFSTVEKELQWRIHNHKQKAQSDRAGLEETGVRWSRDGNQYIFFAHNEDLTKINAARVAAEAGLRTPTSKWKCIDSNNNTVFINLSNEELIEISNLLLTHMQACFDAEAIINEKVDNQDFSSTVFKEYEAIMGIDSSSESGANTTPTPIEEVPDP